MVGYYALATGSIERLKASKKIARNMPRSIPVLVLGRLAVDMQFQGMGLGSGLLKDVLLRTVSVTHNVGVRALLVHTLSEQAKQFYSQFGFQESVMDPRILFLSIRGL